MNRSGMGTEPGCLEAEASRALSMAEEFDTEATFTMTPFCLPSVSLKRAMASFRGDLVWLPYTCHMVRVTGLSGFSLLFLSPQPARTRAKQNKKRRNSFFIMHTSEKNFESSKVCLM